MDRTIVRLRASGCVLSALSAVNVASELSREAKAFQVSSQLHDLAEELVYLHRQLLELPAEKTPAACEFERAQLDEDLPF